MATMFATLPDFKREAALDEVIDCRDCGETFVWSVGEQEFFREKGLQHTPVRCKPCKQFKTQRIAELAALPKTQRPRIEVEVNCAKCGTPTVIPFYPSQGRPVYCRPCLNGQS